MCKTCLSGIHCPVQLHLATSMHLGKEEGRKDTGSTRLDLIFPIPGSLPLAACKWEGDGREVTKVFLLRPTMLLLLRLMAFSTGP